MDKERRGREEGGVAGDKCVKVEGVTMEGTGS